MIQMGTPEGPDAGGATWATVEPRAINAHGEVVGLYERTLDTGVYRSAFRWTAQRGFTIITENADAVDINDNGDVVGYFYPCAPPVPNEESPCRIRGFLWSASRGFVDLGTMIPVAMNNAGRIVGHCEDLGACYRISATNIRRLPARFTPADLNERGVVVGAYEWEELGGETRAALWMSSTGLQYLERSPELESSLARSINESSMSVGYGAADGAVPKLFTPFGAVTGPFTGYGIANAISDRGWIVGVVDGKPALWRMGKKLMQLPLPEGTNTGFAVDVNDDGLVVGAVLTSRGTRSLLWIAR